MVVDHWTAEVVTALRSAGVEPVLLKGSAVARWLYPDEPGARGYADADLLVRPDDRAEAGRVLSGLGFEPLPSRAPPARGGRPPRAVVWYRARDRAAVDLHTTVHGTDHLDPWTVWRVVTRDAERLEVHGVDVAVPCVPVRALHLVLHLRPKDDPGSQAWRDLERAVVVVPDEVWTDAAGIADDLGLRAEMGWLLRLVAGGPALAERLGLPAEAPAALVVQHERVAWPKARRLLDDVVRRDTRAALVQLGRELFPRPSTVRARWPEARRGRVALVGVYLRRLRLVPVRLGEWARAGRGGEPRRRPGAPPSDR
jgi:hypothetical protein